MDLNQMPHGSMLVMDELLEDFHHRRTVVRGETEVDERIQSLRKGLQALRKQCEDRSCREKCQHNLEKMVEDAEWLIGFMGSMFVQYQIKVDEADRDVGLTDLPTKRAMRRIMSAQVEMCQKYGDMMAVMYFDGDEYGMPNKAIGHAKADRLFLALAKSIAHDTRKDGPVQDLVARPDIQAGRDHGDEFVASFVMPSETSLESFKKLFARLQEDTDQVGTDFIAALSRADRHALYRACSNRYPRLSVSIGMAVYDIPKDRVCRLWRMYSPGKKVPLSVHASPWRKWRAPRETSEVVSELLELADGASRMSKDAYKKSLGKP